VGAPGEVEVRGVRHRSSTVSFSWQPYLPVVAAAVVVVVVIVVIVVIVVTMGLGGRGQRLVVEVTHTYVRAHTHAHAQHARTRTTRTHTHTAELTRVGPVSSPCSVAPAVSEGRSQVRASVGSRGPGLGHHGSAAPARERASGGASWHAASGSWPRKSGGLAGWRVGGLAAERWVRCCAAAVNH
jgi:hypothetical protein